LQRQIDLALNKNSCKKKVAQPHPSKSLAVVLLRTKQKKLPIQNTISATFFSAVRIELHLLANGARFSLGWSFTWLKKIKSVIIGIQGKKIVKF